MPKLKTKRGDKKRFAMTRHPCAMGRRACRYLAFIKARQNLTTVMAKAGRAFRVELDR
jgi:hypothetical protein